VSNRRNNGRIYLAIAQQSLVCSNGCHAQICVMRGDASEFKSLGTEFSTNGKHPFEISVAVAIVVL
jgi:hypothetical protein